MIPKEINYLLSHPAHACFLVCSVETLRHHSPDIPINLHAWPESAMSPRERRHCTINSVDICQEIAKAYDNVQVVVASPGQKARKRHLIHKIEIIYDRGGMLLDADTLINNPIDDFFVESEGFEVTTTQFCDWHTNKPIMVTRIKRLLDIEGIEHEYVNQAITNPYPSPNVGVFSAEKNSKILKEWRDWSIKAAGVFIADETTFQCLQIKYADQVNVLLGGKYNCSTMKYQPKGLEDDDVVVWHGHGASFVRPNKAVRGHAMWFHIFKQFLETNKCKAKEWSPLCNNHRLPPFLDPTYEPEKVDHPYKDYVVK